MTEDTTTEVPQYSVLMEPTLISIHTLGGSASIKEITDQVIDLLALPPSVTQVPHGKGSQTEVEYRLAWARTYLKKVGLLDNSERGVWSLTVLGRETESIDSTAIVRTVNQQNRVEREHRTKSETFAEETEFLVEEPDTEAESWRDQLVGILQTMPSDAFERLCQRILRESGFIEVEVTGKSGDGGIDGFGIIRLAGLISFPVLFQCKRYSGSVSAQAVRDFRGAMIGRADKGVILTTGTFTRDAQREASRDGAPPIDLIDGELLIERLSDLRLGVNTRVLEVVEIDADFFNSI